jgi:hypothetical protein
MEKIHAVGNLFSYSQFFHPVRLFRKVLLSHGFDVRFYFNIEAKGIEDCDILLFYSDCYRSMLPIEKKDRQSVVSFLHKYFAKFSRVIWFDSTDSSGWLRSYIFPYVDIYAKSQVLKNLSFYLAEHKAGILHRDYVIDAFNISDNKVAKEPISFEDSKKIRVSWRQAYRNPNKFDHIPYVAPLIQYLPPMPYPYKFTLPNLSKRSRTIQYRVRKWENDPTIHWWREQTGIRLEQALKKHPEFQYIDQGSVPFKAYFKELTQNFVTVSPFGLNEFCLRDIWAFVSGSLLFKPNMDHVRSFPDYYQAGETYVSHAWDFSDFEEKLDEILTHPAHYEEIAREGQKRFKLAMTDAEGFARHFEEMVSP